MNYDIIGDIHGHADELEALLASLGYRETRGAWRHPSRQAIFVGDFIDRGPRQIETVELVRRMIDGGSALAVMGNHEFNAVAWFLPDPEEPWEYLRKHHSPKYGEKNRQQHHAFLAAVEGTPRHEEMIRWFLGLPVYLDLPGLRIVHACWHPGHLAFLRPHLTHDNCLTVDKMAEAAREPVNDGDKNSTAPTVFTAIETLLKGIEARLPAPHTFRDKDGHERNQVRIRWWDNNATSFRDAAMLPEDERSAFPQEPVPSHALIGHDEGKPVFVGHYWLTGAPVLLSNKVACVDYSVAKKGKLVAYRWDGETELDGGKLHWVGQ